MSGTLPRNIDILQRMVDAVEAVRQRLLRATAALKSAGVPYAVVGGNAVAAWVATVDRAAVRNTQDVDILIRRADFDGAKAALEGAGFVYRRAAGLDLFLDGADASPRDAVRLHIALSGAGVEESTELAGMRVLNLIPLVETKLGVFNLGDRVDVRDMIDVGLIDQSWTKRLPSVLATRLQQLLDTPEG